MTPISLYTHPIFLKHISQLAHPENPKRIQAIDAALQKEQLPVVYFEATPCDRKTLELVHPHAYLDRLFGIGQDTHIDGDTYMCKNTMNAVLHVCGGLIAAADNILKGSFKKAMLIGRPPGHHAEPKEGMGFCLVNSIAVLANYLVKEKEIERLAIIDFDVHHGNGTEKAVKGNKKILFCSTYQQNIYPVGTVHGRNENILNVPLQAFAGSEQYREIFVDQVISAVSAFKPQIMLVSAGFDAHRMDPLAQINLENKDFQWLGEQISLLAKKMCGERVISCLEGGYNLDVVGESVISYLTGLSAD